MGDVSGQTRPTRPTAGDSVGTAATRTAGRGCDEAQSLAATVRHRRPSDPLTPSQCPQLDGETRERRHVSSSTDNSGRHAVQQRHTHSDGSASARPSGSYDSHSNSQDPVRTHCRTHTRTYSPTTLSTTIGLLSFTLLIRLCLGSTTVSQLLTQERFTPLSLRKLSHVTLSQSLLNLISQLKLIHSHQTRSFTRT